MTTTTLDTASNHPGPNCECTRCTNAAYRLYAAVLPATFEQAIERADNCARVAHAPFYVVRDQDGYHVGDGDDLRCYWPTLVAKYSTTTGALDTCLSCGDPVDGPGVCAACREVGE